LCIRSSGHKNAKQNRQTEFVFTNQPLTGSIAGANADLFYTIFFPFLPQHQENQHPDQDYKNEDQLIWKIWFEKLLFYAFDDKR